MHRTELPEPGPSRRSFLVAAGSVIAGASLSRELPAAISPAGSGRRRRMNLADPKAAKDLSSYERAIGAMIKLPPTDPRNWYRIALIHLLDCPHGNWWFLPWHRGYLGWIESICREQSGDPDFAFPYWDWTAQPQLPAPFLLGNLNPANFPIKSLQDFKDTFAAPLEVFWKGLNPDQLAQLKLRRYNSIDDVWKDITGDPANPDKPSKFSDLADVRALNPPHSPDFDEITNKAVSLSTLLDGLSPRDFVSFGSAKKTHHHHDGMRVDFGVLEGQPHNKVHNVVGGFVQGAPSRQGLMTDFLSPLDPIFFMHHSNIDRLWDVWTRKQQALDPKDPTAPIQYPTAPEMADLTAWNSEPFLFFVDKDGNPTAKKHSGDVNEVATFNYDYQSGSGEEFVPSAPAPAPAIALARRSFTGKMSNAVATFPRGTEVSNDLLQALTTNNRLRVLAKISVAVPADARALRLHVLINPPKGVRSVNFRDPSYAGSFEFFGSHTMDQGTHDSQLVGFTIGITDAVKKLYEQRMLKPDVPLEVHVVAAPPGVQLEPYELKVSSVELQFQ